MSPSPLRFTYELAHPGPSPPSLPPSNTKAKRQAKAKEPKMADSDDSSADHSSAPAAAASTGRKLALDDACVLLARVEKVLGLAIPNPHQISQLTNTARATAYSVMSKAKAEVDADIAGGVNYAQLLGHRRAGGEAGVEPAAKKTTAKKAVAAGAAKKTGDATAAQTKVKAKGNSITKTEDAESGNDGEAAKTNGKAFQAKTENTAAKKRKRGNKTESDEVTDKKSNGVEESSEEEASKGSKKKKVMPAPKPKTTKAKAAPKLKAASKLVKSEEKGEDDDEAEGDTGSISGGGENNAETTVEEGDS